VSDEARGDQWGVHRQGAAYLKERLYFVVRVRCRKTVHVRRLIS